MVVKIQSSAQVDGTAVLGKGTQIWDHTQIRENVRLGDFCIVGRNVYIGAGVVIGSNCKIQNNALIYEPALIANGVFIGPGAILTNDHNPRAVNIDGSTKSAEDWEQVGVTLGEGCSIGAGAICIAPVSVGRWALIGAGSIVTKNVPNFALMLGSPAKQVGWVGRSGHKLDLIGNQYVCPVSERKYTLAQGELTEMSDN